MGEFEEVTTRRFEVNETAVNKYLNGILRKQEAE